MALILMAGLTQAATINVGPGQSIQAAIDAAKAGDVIEVQKGTYQENINIKIMPMTMAPTSGMTAARATTTTTTPAGTPTRTEFVKRSSRYLADQA
jgi:nitrous oxidase accessory protein NosD